MFANLRQFLAELARQGELREIDAEVDPRLEIAEIHRRVIEAGGPALLFRRPRGSAYPVVTNLFGTRRRIDLAFGPRPAEFVRQLARAAVDCVPPTLPNLWKSRSLLWEAARVGTRKVKNAPVLDVRDGEPRLSALPILTCSALDGGPFVTLGSVYTEHPDAGLKQSNLGIYRLQVFTERQLGFHAQIGKGGGFHFHEAERQGRDLPVSVFLGGPPALTLASIAPLPEGVPELLLASLACGRRIPMASTPGGGHRLISEAEFALRGRVLAGRRRLEGPFGDHYGYYSLAHEYPVIELDEVWHRRGAVYPATIVGKPRQEDYYLGDYLQELLSPLFPLVMPSVVDLWSYGDTGFHSLAAAVVKDRYPREAMQSAFRILGEGQLSLTKFLILTDARIDVRNFKGLLEHVLARCDSRRDLFVFSNVSMDTLDYTGPRVNEGSKGVLLGLGAAARELPRAFEGKPPAGCRAAAVYCAGCLVVEGSTAGEDPELPARVAADPAVAAWPLVVLADDAVKTTSSDAQFLWRVFTRFEPAADLRGAAARIVRNHVAFEAPVVLDARVKPWFPSEVDPDAETSARVDRRWKEYFPSGT